MVQRERSTALELVAQRRADTLRIFGEWSSDERDYCVEGLGRKTIERPSRR